MMKSRVAELAKERGIESIQRLCFAAEITWPTAKLVWEGDLSKTRAETLRKLAATFECSMEDLFIYIEDAKKAAS